MPKVERVNLACDSCRHRKIRCDARHPICGNCAKRKLECLYTPSQRQSTTEGRFGALSGRLERIERKLDSLVHINSTSSNNDSSKTEPESGSRADLGIPLFNDRLSVLKSHLHLYEDASIVYSSGIFMSLLSPHNVHRLSKMFDDPLLEKKLAAKSAEEWRQRHEILLSVIKNVNILPPTFDGYDIKLLDYCIAEYRRVAGRFLHILISPADAESRPWLQNEDFVILRAAIVYFVGFTMQVNGNWGPFSPELVKSQRHMAFMQMIPIVNGLGYMKPSFYLLRCALFSTWVINALSTMPFTMNFALSAVKFARSIELDNPSANSRFPAAEAQRREDVWTLCCGFEHSFSITLSRKSSCQVIDISAGENLSLSLTDSGEVDQSLRNMRIHFMEIQSIYDRVQERLFNIPDNRPGEKILHDVQSLDADIANWYSRLPVRFTELIHPPQGNYRALIDWKPLHNLQLKYWHTLLAVHSIPAFHADLLPEPMPESINIMTKGAHELLRLALLGQEATFCCTALLRPGITTATVILLYKQLYYPRYPDSHRDLEVLRETLSKLDMGTFSSTRIIWDTCTDLLAQLLDNSVAEVLPVAHREYGLDFFDHINYQGLGELDNIEALDEPCELM